MTGAELPLAHHSLVVAVPFAGPALALSAGLVFLALRERRANRGDREGDRA